MVGTKHYGRVSKLAEGIGLDDPLPLHAYTDSDWAGSAETHRSSSGEAIVLAGAVVETSSITQPGVPATSSGEAELRALTRCGQSAVYARNLAQNDSKLEIDTPRMCDSSAALQAAKRIGMGKMRRVTVGDMYIQELVLTKQVIIGKIDGKASPANTLTKHLATASEMLESLEGLGVVDLTNKGFEERVRRTKLKAVSSVGFRKRKPLQASQLSLRLSAATKNFAQRLVGDSAELAHLVKGQTYHERVCTETSLNSDSVV